MITSFASASLGNSMRCQLYNLRIEWSPNKKHKQNKSQTNTIMSKSIQITRCQSTASAPRSP